MKQQLLELNQRLLNAILKSDWTVYSELVDPSLSCFEPESIGHLVEGMDFHKYYFDLNAGKQRVLNLTMASPHVRFMANNSVAIVSYIRLVQRVASDTGAPTTTAAEETRVWEK